jgi:hypothetical protein
MPSTQYLTAIFLQCIRVKSRKNGGEPSGCELTGNGRVATTFLDDQRLSPLGNLIQSVLAEEDLVEQTRHIQFRTCCQETFLRLFGDILPYQCPCPRCPCVVVHLGDVAPSPFLVRELLAGKEPVHHEVQREAQSVQETLLSLAVMPVIPHERADGRRTGGMAPLHTA